jgi:hypothetical protein
VGEWIRRQEWTGKREKKKEEKRKRKRRKNKEKKKKKKGQFRHFTTSIQQVKLFCQTFSKTASAQLEKPLHRRSKSRSRF